MHVKPVCVSCQVAMEPECNGALVIEYFMDPPKPYRYWSADVWKCPLCGLEIAKGFCEQPHGEHYEPDFAEHLLKETEYARRIVHEFEVRYEENASTKIS